MNDKCVDTEVHSISRRGILAFTAAVASGMTGYLAGLVAR